jgi:hypothetical protein
MNLITLAMFAAILLISLGITAWAARRTRTTVDFYAAGKGLTAAQNGFALAGDWCSAAAFLGFTGLTALYGMDGALYAVGPLVAFCTVLSFSRCQLGLLQPLAELKLLVVDARRALVSAQTSLHAVALASGLPLSELGSSIARIPPALPHRQHQSPMRSGRIAPRVTERFERSSSIGNSG